ncbi:MAG: glycogen/starch synthase, partial [Candidatus Omnitrophota bacterium]
MTTLNRLSILTSPFDKKIQHPSVKVKGHFGIRSSLPLAKPRRAAAGSPVSLASKDILMRNGLNAHFTAAIVTIDIKERERDLLQAASQNGTALFVIKPLFWADVKAGYGTIVKFMQAYGASHLMDIEVPVDRGSTLSLSVIYAEQEGLQVLYLYEPSGNLFVKLHSYPHPDSLGGYIEAIVLPLASLVIQNKLNIQFDAFYFIDWQAALGPVFLKEFYGGNRENEWLLGRRPAALFMPRTLEYQGIFPGCVRVSYKDKLTQYLFKRGVLMLHRYYQDPIANAYPADHKDEVIVELFKLTNLNPKLRDKTDDGLEFGSRDFVGNTLVFGRHNLMKGVLLYADRIVFDSEGKMKKALTPEGGYGLDGVLRAQRQKLVHSPIKNPFIFAEKKALSASPIKIVKEALRILEMYSNEYRFKTYLTGGFALNLIHGRAVNTRDNAKIHLAASYPYGRVYIVNDGNNIVETAEVRGERIYDNLPKNAKDRAILIQIDDNFKVFINRLLAQNITTSSSAVGALDSQLQSYRSSSPVCLPSSPLGNEPWLNHRLYFHGTSVKKFALIIKDGLIMPEIYSNKYSKPVIYLSHPAYSQVGYFADEILLYISRAKLIKQGIHLLRESDTVYFISYEPIPLNCIVDVEYYKVIKDPLLFREVDAAAKLAGIINDPGYQENRKWLDRINSSSPVKPAQFPDWLGNSFSLGEENGDGSILDVRCSSPSTGFIPSNAEGLRTGGELSRTKCAESTSPPISIGATNQISEIEESNNLTMKLRSIELKTDQAVHDLSSILSAAIGRLELMLLYGGESLSDDTREKIEAIRHPIRILIEKNKTLRYFLDSKRENKLPSGVLSKDRLN